MQIYKILSALLEYPDQELIEHLPEIRAEIKKSAEISAEESQSMLSLMDHLTSISLTELQASYVKTFDMTPEHSLHLTHHLFGDDNDKNRGPALIDLSELYKDYGVKTMTNELPDYLPLVLEFVSFLDDEEATSFLADAIKVLKVLTDNLIKANSPYASLLSIIQTRATPVCVAA